MSNQPHPRSEQLTLQGNEQALQAWDALSVDRELHVDQLIAEVQRYRASSAAGVAQVSPSQAGILTASGVQYRMEFDRPVKVPETGATVSGFTTHMLFGELAGGEEGQRVGIIATTMFALAPGGDTVTALNKVVRAIEQGQQGGQRRSWAEATEHAFEPDRGLFVADGIWDAFRGCLGGCGGTCLAALTACLAAGALPAVAACVAISCGGCALRCAACVACDCSFFCRWAVGCCDQ
ncbi:hypothetical protein [Streptomyces virginiae]|uniref:hypothetical protein n=1 Tax=Streptomyces virginiae TaxID=1961 RepID=UPI0022590BC7|nr:hypothetical protein [Streptomyces virginiae]MCX5174323.1 hypothetical protein [Streptomyces virginiae]